MNYPIIKRESIIIFLKEKHLHYFGKNFLILTTTPYIRHKDIIELYLYISGNKKFAWTDESGQIIQADSFITNLKNILFEGVSWFFILRKIKRYLGGIQSFPSSIKNPSKVFFFRTDHAFNIKSGGSVGHLSGVINGLRHAGIRTYVFSSDKLAEVAEKNDFTVISPDFSKIKSIPQLSELSYNILLIEKLKEKIVMEKPDFIYQRYSLANFTGVYLASMSKIPFVLEYNGSEVWIAKNWGKGLLHETICMEIENINLKLAALIVVVSRVMQEELINRGIESNKIFINPNGVDLEKYSPYINGNEVIHQYNLFGKTVFGFIGTFGPWHGAENIVRAYDEMLKANHQMKKETALLMVGDGVMMPEIKKLITEYDLENEVILTGLVPQSEGPKYLAACDILINATVPNPDGTPFFGSPTKLFEYMAMGKAIISSDMDQMSELLQHDHTAFMVKPGSIEELHDAMKTLISNTNLREKLGINARNQAVAEHSWDKHVEKILQKLEDATN